jgi:prepilin-type N-terminal cleavage/methylation domain-containing protein
MKSHRQPFLLSPARPNRGFSLIELLVVIAIILVIAALAIPNFLRSKMRANEAAAAAALRGICTAQETYRSIYARGYAPGPGLTALQPPPAGTPPSAGAADLIDPVLAAGTRQGYTYSYVPIDADGDGQPEAYTVNADPAQVGKTGEKHFYVDQTNVVRENLGGPANASSPPVPK